MYFAKSSTKSNKANQQILLTPSQLAQSLIRIPGEGDLESFSFTGQRYFPPIYDDASKRILMLAGRQIGKSTALGNIILTKSIAIPYFLSLYVSPTILQTGQFSNDRIKMPVAYSPKLQPFFREDLVDRVNHRVLTNGSEIRLRNAFLNADRIRGIRADLICIDELQSIIVDLIPVIEQTTFHSSHKYFLYSGTPLTEDNTISQYWSKYSTQNEWVIPCDNAPEHGGKRQWNVVNESNIPDDPEDKLVCSSCKKTIHPMHPSAQWVSMNPNPTTVVPFEGYRVPQVITPMVDWREVLDYRQRYTRARFVNEVLGMSCDSGNRPISIEEIKQNCHPEISMFAKGKQFSLERCRELARRWEVFMGIDWGADTDRSYTYISMGSYFGTKKFHVFYLRRLEGPDAEPPSQIRICKELISEYNVRLVGSDYGGGLDRNDALLRVIGASRLFRYQYAARPKRKVKWDQGLGRFIISRSEIMNDILAALKRGNYFCLPNSEEVFSERGIAYEMLCLRSEYNEQLRIVQYNHAPGATDDGFHSLVYLTLVAGVMFARPDIVLPGVTHGGAEEAITMPTGNDVHKDWDDLTGNDF